MTLSFLQSRLHLLKGHSPAMAIQQRASLFQHSLHSFRRQSSPLPLLLLQRVSDGLLFMLYQERDLFFVMVVASFVEVDF